MSTARLTKTGQYYGFVLCSCYRVCALAERERRVSRRSATRTTAVMPTSFVMWPAGSRRSSLVVGNPCHTAQTRNRRCSVECVDAEQCDRTGGGHHGGF